MCLLAIRVRRWRFDNQFDTIMMTNIDLLLVVGYFRSATSFLPVIRYLSPQMRIAVMFVDVDESLKGKTGAANALFVKLCRQFGATIVPIGTTLNTRLMVVQQFPYAAETVVAIRDTVKTRRTIGLMTLASAGFPKHDLFIAQFGIDKVYVPDRKFMQFLLEKRQAAMRYQDVEVVEVGLPFKRYPVFPEFSTDWLIAAPTLFSFQSEAGKHDFLRTVLKLLARIPAGEQVLYKSHNGNMKDYFSPRAHYLVAKVLVHLPGFEQVLEWAIGIFRGAVKRHLEKLLTCVLHLRILRRALPMATTTPYADISLEAFLPGVRKGVIGGLSNTMWGVQHFGLPYFNCVDPRFSTSKSQLLNKDSSDYIYLNIEYFGVQFCNGESRPVSVTATLNVGHGDLLRAVQEDCEKRHALHAN